MVETPLYKAHCVIFKRYIETLKEADPGDEGDKTSPRHLISLCEQAILRPDAPDDKISRWLGFVQGIMAVKGLIKVDEERDFTRPIFHKAYREMGILNPPSITA